MIEKSRGYLIARALATIAVTELVDDVCLECVRVRARGHVTSAEVTALRLMVEEAQRRRAAYDLEVPGFETMMLRYREVCGDDVKLGA